MTPDLAYITAVEALELFRTNQLSPVELLKAQIQRIESFNDQVNCIAYNHFEDALQAAKESEQRYLKGDPLPLDGIPCAIEDDADVKGWRHPWGSLLLKEKGLAEADSPVVDLIRRTGAVMHIQTTTPEFHLAGVTWSHLWGVTRNPWNPDYTPGGSSGGSSAALAAGFTTLSLGSDMDGSIRIPAAMCGLYGYKPPFGRVPSSDVPYHSYGPLARTFLDMNLLQQYIGVPHPLMHASLKPKLDYPETFGSTEGWKVAVYSLKNYKTEIDVTVIESMISAVTRLQDIGCELVEVDLGFRHDDFEIMLAGLMSTGMGVLAALASQGLDAITPYVRYYLETYGDKIGPQHALAAAELAARYQRQVQEKVFQQGFKAIVMPTMLTPYVKADWFSSPETATVTVNKQQVESRLCFFATWMWNLLGNYPVINVPVSMTKENIPQGVQLVTDTFDDLTALQLAKAFSSVDPGFFKETFPSL
jgi:amidase